MDDILNFSLRGFSVLQLGIGLLVVFLAFASARVAQIVLRKLLSATTEHTLRYAVIESLQRPVVWALRLGGVWGALTTLPLASIEAFDLQHFVNRMYQATTIGLATWLGVRLVSNLAGLWAHRAADTAGTFDDQLVPIVRSAARVFLIITGTVMILQNLGYSVGSLLAGVGIGGAAIAFASKDAIANVFGSLVIFVDRPFQIGDWVEIGEVEGTVEEVRMRVTAIRTFANSVVTVPNSQMTITPIHNWSRMRKRRLKLEVRVAYGTDPDQLQAAVEGIRKLIEEDERFDSQFYLVNFNEMSEWSLNIFIYCFTKTTMWAEHMEIREALLLSVMRLLRERDITQAVPARSISVEGGSSRPGLPPGLRRPA